MKTLCARSIIVAVLAVLLVGCSLESEAEQARTQISAPDVKRVMQRVADWQLAQYRAEDNSFPLVTRSDHVADMDVRGWVYAALHVGLSRWAEISDSPVYYDRLREIAKKNGYLVGPRIYNADDYAIGQLYIDLYQRDQKAEYITPLKVIFDQILANPSTADMTFQRFEGVYDSFSGEDFLVVPNKNRWSWADAVFMGPPVWMHLAEVTGDRRYLDFADREFWAMADLLYDKEERLFLRDTRFLTLRDDNGQKIAWGRGNGWVLAGLARMLDHIPAKHPNRERYENLFREFAGRVIELQDQNGFWRPSLLNPEAYPDPDSSGGGFFVYGLAWGVNNGLLDAATTLPAIEKGWRALVGAVHPDGKLGWVQQIAAAPGSTTFDDTQLYGVGAFLLAGSEVYKLASSE